jgi:CheY-like chemotaxis protein
MGPKILVVDDEPYMLRLMKYHLDKAGYDMLPANNGQEAIELAAREAPRLVIMDVMMADMDGLTALKALKRSEVTRDIPVIMLTASALQLTRQESEAGGATLFFTKPFSPTRLLAEIQRLVPCSDTPAV